MLMDGGLQPFPGAGSADLGVGGVARPEKRKAGGVPRPNNHQKEDLEEKA